MSGPGMSRTDEKLWAKEMIVAYIDKGVNEAFNSLDTNVDEERQLIQQRHRVVRFLGLPDHKYPFKRIKE